LTGLVESGKATEIEKSRKWTGATFTRYFLQRSTTGYDLFQSLALIKLGKNEDVKARFNKLIDFGNAHLNNEFKLDYITVSLPDLQIWEDDLTKRNRQNCRNLIELGESGISGIVR